MAFPTLPTNFPFLWATAGTVTVPSGGDRLSGWTFEQAPPYDWFNWLGWGSGQGLEYLKGYLDTFHDPATGRHIKIRYPAASPRLVTIPMGSYDKGGWFLGSATTIAPNNNDGATPPNTGMPGGVGTLSMIKEIPLIIGPDDAIGDEQWYLWGVLLTNKRPATAGNTFTWSILSMPVSGAGAYAVVSTGTMANAAWARSASQVGTALPVYVDPANRYFVRIVMVQGAGAAADEVAIADVSVEIKRLRLE